MHARTGKPLVAAYCTHDQSSACPAIRLARPLHHADWTVRWGAPNRWTVDVNAARGADLAIVQRNLPSFDTHAALREVTSLGIPIVYDLDDAFLDLSADHSGHSQYEAQFPYIRWMLRQADLITVSTAPLARALRRHSTRPIAVLPNMVDWNLFDTKPRQRGQCCNLMVSGTPTHLADWALIGQPLAELLAERPGQLKVTFIGDLPERFKGHPAVQSVGFESSYERYAGLIRGLDAHIALVPLDDSEFNRAKSDIKWLEYSAAGIPGIYSDIEPYRAAISHGKDGWLVQNTPQAWKTAISSLVDDASLCRALIDSARSAVLTRHSIAAGLPAFEQTLGRLVGSMHVRDPRADLLLAPVNLKSNARRMFDRHIAWRFNRET